MPPLSDRQRIELAIPAYLLLTFTGAPGMFVPVDPALIQHAEARVGALRQDLRAASLEPFSDLAPKKQGALIRRLDRIAKTVIATWKEQPAITTVLTLWCFLKDLVDREVLILWERTAMDRAMDKLLPMFEHGFDQPGRLDEAKAQAARVLDQLRSEGLFA
ncbi:hypothetical protein ACQKQD_33935 [Methylobacterium sp. NPDC080182]|uniref:hypothetical protein n=1 Tax=Methylobacterium sp. NPDC080182 TaxID=3390590 RepID=UPI003D018FA4